MRCVGSPQDPTSAGSLCGWRVGRSRALTIPSSGVTTRPSRVGKKANLCERG